MIIEDVGKVKSCSMGGTGENIFLQEQIQCLDSTIREEESDRQDDDLSEPIGPSLTNRFLLG
jgi:hypothetical protein